ncbi:tripartite tricarboxylate transporter substrate binding protein [Polaromonas sp. P1(28)-13]|nr:tripartite tricarboxylate transporter substrate binding protein [Polaromonas sp. P1(28)-13]
MPHLRFLPAGFVIGQSFAQSFPTKPIRIIASTPPGGSIDYVSRILAQKLPASLGQSAIVENKAGASGNIAAEYVARSVPDGHTLLVVASSHATNLNLYANMSYDPVRDFAPVSLLTTNYFVVAVPGSSPAKTFSELIALAKTKKGGLNYGSSGSGQGNHLGMELLKSMAGFEAVHVPFSGIGPTTSALLGGQIDVALLTPPGALPHVKSGRLKILAVTSPKRFPSLPNVPTVAESGVPGYELSGWIGLLAPASTPKDVVDKLQRETVKVLNQPEVITQLDVVSAEPVGSTSQEFAGVPAIRNCKVGKDHQAVRREGRVICRNRGRCERHSLSTSYVIFQSYV